ncbi:MAG: twin-arginine translocation pathway signal protein [Rhizobiales bacterium 65-9]|nr:twin-arginine translocation pathway signal protein [Hyphomicrobiales bacterium]OJY32616.1 MAG: twin-arginine translocation pathway signal protein [Rhizobiales bacterium 65-9]
MGGAAALAVSAVGVSSAVAQQAGDRIRKIIINSAAQAADPQEFQAAQLVAQEWRKLGLEVEVRGMPRPQLSDLVWFNREKWDTTMWRMVGRPERSDPDEVVYNLFHSSNRDKGFNFVGYNNPAYDSIAEKQRRELDLSKRKALINEAQDIIMHDQPYFFLVYPKNVAAYLANVWKKESIVDQSGIGIRNFWTFTGAQPVGAQKDMICNATESMIALNPLYISGAIDSWVTDLVWDRLMRVGPDGLPKPWAAESATWVNDTTLDVKVRKGMKWHDGKPVTLDDVIFSFEAPAGDKSPMYKPFVSNIAKMEKQGDDTVRFTLKEPNASFFTATLSKINLIPKHVWEPTLQKIAGTPQTAEQQQEAQPIGSGPFKVNRFKLQEEIVLDKFADHWAAPKADRWIMRIVTNTEAALGMLRRGEVNFLSDYRGDPKLLEDIAKQNKDVVVASTVDMGFRFVAPNLRRPPFNDVNFREALELVINRNLMAQAAWNGFAVPANSHVSAALTAWHKPEKFTPSLDAAKKKLQDAGYRVVSGKLHYPAGVKETMTPN